MTRFPDPDRPNLLARLEVRCRAEPDPQITRLRGAIPRRRTDRRGFAATPVPPATLSHFQAVAEAEGCALHVIEGDQMATLTMAAAEAAALELADPAYRAQLSEWTDRPPGSDDGVPTATAAQSRERPILVRDFAPDAQSGPGPGEGDDSGATYAILYGADDDPQAWLSAGEALSAILLTAVLEKVGVSPMSDVLEVNEPRELVRRLLPYGHPYLGLRLGVPATTEAPARTPRRRADKVVRFDGSRP